MKKIFIVLGVTLLAMAACTKFVEETIPADILKPSGEGEVGPAAVAAPTIEQVEATHSTDSTFAVKITPASGNNFYSFAIVEGALPADAEGILTGSYKKNCVTVKLIIDEVETEVPLFGSFEASKQADTTVVAFDLIPNTTYTVYAVANNKNGTLSDIASLEITTTDQDAPVPYTVDEKGKKSWKYDASNLEDGTFVVKFDDAIEFTDALKEGKANFYVTYLSANSTHDEDGYDEWDQIFTAPGPVDSLSADGKEVSIQVPERIPGAAVLVSFDAGVVKTVTKTAEGEEKELENPAISYGGYYYSSGKPKEYGLAARFKTASWKFARSMVVDENTGKLVRTPADTTIYFSDAESFMLPLVAQNLAEPQWQKDENGEKASYNYIADYSAPTLIYTDAKKRQVSQPAEEYYYGAMQDSVFVALLAEEPGYGSAIAINVAAESVEDLWGNACEEFSTIYEDEDKNVTYGNYFYSYGFSLKDVYGTYKLVVNNNTINEDIIITPREKFDDPTYEEYYAERNVAIYNLFDAYFAPAIEYYLDSYTSYETTHYATFNIHSGIMNVEYEYIGEGSWAKQNNWANYVIAEGFSTSDGNYNFAQTEAGLMTLQDDVMCYLNKLGYISLLNAGATIVKISDDYTLPEEEEGPAEVSKLASPSKAVAKNVVRIR